MKAVIPVAGVGSRLRPHTHTQPKALIPVAGKPILSHIVDSLREAGFNDFVFIIGYLGDKIRDYVSSHYEDKINAEFVEQHKREGIAHAIWTCSQHIEGEDSLVIALGDTIFDMDMKKFMQLPHSALGTKHVDDPRSFGVAELDENGFIKKLVEKPSIPKSNLALVGIYKIDEPDKMLQSIKHIIDNDIRTKNEYQLTDALMHMIDNNSKFVSFTIENWFDCGKKQAVLDTNAILLKRPNTRTEEYAGLQNSVIIQPVNIGKNCRIKDSVIGPNVSIGEEVVIESSVVSETIIGHFANIKDVVLHSSLVGNDVLLKGVSQSLNIGDSTEINMG